MTSENGSRWAAPGVDRVGLIAVASGSAGVGGVFAAFSGIVLPAIVRLPTGQAVSTMQLLNQAALRPAFMIPFMGTTALSLGIAVRQLTRSPDRRSVRALGGSLLYLSSFVVTAAYHVPRNDRLQAMAADSAGAASYWSANVDGWRRMNDVRAGLCLAGAALYVAALGERTRP